MQAIKMCNVMCNVNVMIEIIKKFNAFDEIRDLFRLLNQTKTLSKHEIYIENLMFYIENIFLKTAIECLI